MDRSTFVRRAFHLASPAWLVWYWMPPDSWVGVRKELVLLLFLCGALLIEATRLITGRHILGLRAHERERVSAYAQGGLGLAIGLLFFPGEYVIPAFCGMAWIDPLCAYTRRTRGYPWFPLVAYTVLATFLFLVVVPLAAFGTTPVPWTRVAFLAPSAAVAAIAVERPNLKHVDDDFIMHIVPLLVLTATAWVV